MASGLEAESSFASSGNFRSGAWLADERMRSWKDWAEAHMETMNPMKENRTTLRIKISPREDINHGGKRSEGAAAGGQGSPFRSSAEAPGVRRVSRLSTFRLVMLTFG